MSIEDPKKSLVLCPGEDEMLVRQIDMGALEEDKSLEVLMAMLKQQYHAVKRCHDSTNEGVYNQFNSVQFLRDLNRIEAYVNREFPPKD